MIFHGERRCIGSILRNFSFIMHVFAAQNKLPVSAFCLEAESGLQDIGAECRGTANHSTDEVWFNVLSVIGLFAIR